MIKLLIKNTYLKEGELARVNQNLSIIHNGNLANLIFLFNVGTNDKKLGNQYYCAVVYIY